MKKAVAYTFIFNNQIFVTEEEKEKGNKTLSGLVSICLSLICVSCANNPYKVFVKPAKCNSYKYSFPIRIMRDWYSLLGSIVEVGSLNRFKSALKRFLKIHKLLVLLLLIVSDPIYICK